VPRRALTARAPGRAQFRGDPAVSGWRPARSCLHRRVGPRRLRGSGSEAQESGEPPLPLAGVPLLPGPVPGPSSPGRVHCRHLRGACPCVRRGMCRTSLGDAFGCERRAPGPDRPQSTDPNAVTRSTGETGRFPTSEPSGPHGRSIVICRSRLDGVCGLRGLGLRAGRHRPGRPSVPGSFPPTVSHPSVSRSKYRATEQTPGIPPGSPGCDPAVVPYHAANRRSPPGDGPLRPEDRTGGRPRDALGRPPPAGRPGAVSTTKTLMRSFFSRPPHDLRRGAPEKCAHRVHEISKLKHPVSRGIMRLEARCESPCDHWAEAAAGRTARRPGPVRPSVRSGGISWFRRDRGRKLARRCRGAPEIGREAP
jgi:hypothetical protein